MRRGPLRETAAWTFVVLKARIQTPNDESCVWFLVGMWCVEIVCSRYGLEEKRQAAGG